MLARALGPECVAGEYATRGFDVSLSVSAAEYMARSEDEQRNHFEVEAEIGAYTFKDGRGGDAGSLHLRLLVERQALDAFARDLRADYDAARAKRESR